MVSARPQPRPSLRVCLTCLARVGPASTEVGFVLIGLHRVLEVKYHASKFLAQLTMPSSSSSPGTAWTPGPRDSALIIWEHSGRRLDTRASSRHSGVESGDTRRSWTTFTRQTISGWLLELRPADRLRFTAWGLCVWVRQDHRVSVCVAK